jgi:hypothetical protein
MQSAGRTGHLVARESGRSRRSLRLRILLLILPVSLIVAILALSTVFGHRTRSPLALRAASDVTSNHSSFTYVPGGQGVAISGRQYQKGAPGILTLSVYGMPPAPGDTAATISADLSNGTGQTVLFLNGPLVAVTVTHDGRLYRQLTLSRPAALSLDPAGLLNLEASMPLAGAGTYELSAELVGVGSNPAFTLKDKPAGS